MLYHQKLEKKTQGKSCARAEPFSIWFGIYNNSVFFISPIKVFLRHYYQFYGSPYLIAGRKAATPAGPSSTAGGGVWINQDIDNRSSYPFKVLVDLHFSKLVRDLQCWQSEEADPTPLTNARSQQQQQQQHGRRRCGCLG